jgi:putative two-component system response regulator
MQVLIVDDSYAAVAFLKEALEITGYEVMTAGNGVEALRILREGSCQLVVCDWEMPEMDGLEFCEAVRSEDLGRYIYTILLTAKEGTENVVRGLTAGADDFITKPYDLSELTGRLRAGVRVLAQETRDLVIFALAKLAESRDPETGEHLERVRNYSWVLAKDLALHGRCADQIDVGFIRLIYITSPLHDIGKVAIPDAVLLKPGKLDVPEFEVMKTHTTHGAETLDRALERYPNARFLRMARDIAAHHHERYDGKGYPDGLAGDRIPLSARIFALADVYDALVSRRVYKPPYSHDVARKIIVEERGTHFDPGVVDAFLRCEDHFRTISEGHPVDGVGEGALPNPGFELSLSGDIR